MPEVRAVTSLHGWCMFRKTSTAAVIPGGFYVNPQAYVRIILLPISHYRPYDAAAIHVVQGIDGSAHGHDIPLHSMIESIAA